VSQFKYLGTTLKIKIWFRRKLRGGWVCLLPFSPEPSVFPSVVKKSKNENIQNYNFVWVRNLVSDTKGGT
jgi:hypothetical protein